MRRARAIYTRVFSATNTANARNRVAFGDGKDIRFGMGLSSVHVSTADRRDGPWLINAISVALLTLLHAAGEALGYDRLLKPNTTSHALTCCSVRVGQIMCSFLPAFWLLTRALGESLVGRPLHAHRSHIILDGTMEKTRTARANLNRMNAPLRKPWTQEQFFAWASSQEGRYEFDGFQPVAMTGGTVNHGIIMRSLHRALDARLRNTSCQPLGPDVGVATVGTAVRYPDALVTCSKLVGDALTVPGAVVVFEVVSSTSGRTDRIVKVREYAAVPSVRRYVILESTSVGLTVFERQDANETWKAITLTGADDVLRMPEINLEIPVGEFYEDVDFANDAEFSEAPAR